MKMIGLVHIGKDAELRYTADGTPVLNLSLAYNYGRKDEHGQQPTQWIDASLWGNRATALEPHLTKGKALVVTLKDMHVHTFDRRDGSTGATIRAKIDDVEFAGGGEQRRERPAPRAPSDAAEPAPRYNDMDEDFDDDIPF